MAPTTMATNPTRWLGIGAVATGMAATGGPVTTTAGATAVTGTAVAATAKFRRVSGMFRRQFLSGAAFVLSSV